MAKNIDGIIPRHGVSANVPTTVLSPGELISTDDTLELYLGDTNGVARPINVEGWWIPKSYALNLSVDGAYQDLRIGQWLDFRVGAIDSGMNTNIYCLVKVNINYPDTSFLIDMTLNTFYTIPLVNSGIDTVAFDSQTITKDPINLKNDINSNSNEFTQVIIKHQRPDNQLWDVYDVKISPSNGRMRTTVIVTCLAQGLSHVTN